MDTCLGLYGTMRTGMEFEYSFVWKLWEYGSLVLDKTVYIHGLEPSILCTVWVWQLLNSFSVGLI